MNRRIALVAGLGLLLAAALVAFLPASTDRAQCGWWGSPEWGQEESKEIAMRYIDIAEQSSELPSEFDTTSGTAAEQAYQIAENYNLCDSKLDTRRTFTIVLIGLAALVPGAIVYVGRRSDA